MGRGSVDDIGQGLDGDLTTTGAVCITSLPCATQGDRGVLRLGDKTTPCSVCGKPGVIVDSLPAMEWDGIATVLDGAEVKCGCPPGTNRLIAPLEGQIGTTSVVKDLLRDVPGQSSAPIDNDIDELAATRNAIIREVRSLGHHFIERSGWHAKEPRAALETDWDYSMIALHHAGRSGSCGFGPRQMVEIQAFHQRARKYSDIGYHYGIDCTGMVYEGRDIRFKGSHLLHYNTGVIGVVLLNNFTTTEEGGGLVALGRKLLGSFGIGTTNQIPEPQMNALFDLITVLRGNFAVKRLGGHKEFPKQQDNEKTCPGNIGMELVLAIRMKTKLLAPNES
jgi:uncharacterized Zn-binding protein involved in type VI secretion